MIAINRNTINTDVIVTFTQKTTLSAPVYYVIEFKNDETNALSYLLLGTNNSSYTYRYDKFTITEKANPNNFNAEIRLTAGDYEYRAFECDANVLNLLSLTSVPNAYDVIQYGKARCYGTASTNTEYNEATTTNTVYEG